MSVHQEKEVDVPANAAELLARAFDYPCMTYGVMEFVEWRRKTPWKWNRPEKRERTISMTREEVLALTFRKKRELQMIGNATFFYDEKKQKRITRLDFSDLVQPHTPDEHDMLESLVRAGSGRSVTVSLAMEPEGLRVKFSVDVPAFERDPETKKIVLKSEMDEKRRLAKEAEDKAAQAAAAAASAAAGAPAKPDGGQSGKSN